MIRKKKPPRKNGAAKPKKQVHKSRATSTKRIEAPYPHFRYYKKSKHPALIVGEQKGKKTDSNGVERDTDEYRYRKVMHGGKEGGRNNEIIYPNPNPKDPEPMGIAKRVRHDKKDNFEEKPLPWKYPKK